MTITSTIKRNQYLGDGTTTVFPYQFRIIQASDIKVIVTTSGVDNVLQLNTDYTLSGVNSPGGGNATLSVAPASGTTVTLVRNAEAIQPENYVENDAFPAESHELALDRVTTVSQTLVDRYLRTLRLPASTNLNDFDGELPNLTSSAAGRAVGVKSDLTGFEYIEVDEPGPDPGDVSGPSSSTNNALARWDGSDGDQLANSSVTLDNNGNMTIEVGANNMPGEIRFREHPSNGSLYTGFSAPNNITSQVVYRLPVADGTAGQVLSTDGNGHLVWIDVDTPAPDPNSLGGLDDVTLSGLQVNDIIVADSTTSWENRSGDQTGSYQIFDTDISLTDEAETRSANIDMDGNEIENALITNYSENSISLSAVGITGLNLDEANRFILDHDQNTTLEFNNAVASNLVSFTLVRIKDATGDARLITWPGSVLWPSGVEPTLTQASGAIDVFTFKTVDGGTTWYGFNSGNNLG